ncbi:MAG TPA: UDP-4-amino-4,6-dideoxy-N-acetyl-beta-L-altrosamine N-acetyltransferase [Caulobacteraceae bacterium]
MIDLRDLEDDDNDRLFRWRREPEVDRWMAGLPPEDPVIHRHWFESFRFDPMERRGWIITVDAEPCGFLALTGLSGAHRRGEWGWFIGDPKARGRGAGRAAQVLGLDRAFHELQLEKVWSEVLADNEIALKAQAGAGFRREGYLRRHVLKDGRFHDVVLLAILKEEWEARRVATRRDLSQSGLIAA